MSTSNLNEPATAATVPAEPLDAATARQTLLRQFNAADPTAYTVIERDHFGNALNIIEGLPHEVALTVEKALCHGTAYGGDKARTCEVVRELTPAEKARHLAQQWMSPGQNHIQLGSGNQLATALELLASSLRTLGDERLCDVWMSVDMQVVLSGDEEHARKATVDALADAIGVSAGHERSVYCFNSGPQLKVFTPASPPEHKHVGGSVGGEGENSAECACGTTFAGFDTHAEVMAALDKHLADAAVSA